jgi:hypothetical protein
MSPTGMATMLGNIIGKVRESTRADVRGSGVGGELERPEDERHIRRVASSPPVLRGTVEFTVSLEGGLPRLLCIRLLLGIFGISLGRAPLLSKLPAPIASDGQHHRFFHCHLKFFAMSLSVAHLPSYGVRRSSSVGWKACRAFDNLSERTGKSNAGG